MYSDLQIAILKAAKFKIKAFDVTILTDDGKLMSLAGNKKDMEAAKKCKQLMDNYKRQRAAEAYNFADELNKFVKGRGV